MTGFFQRSRPLRWRIDNAAFGTGPADGDCRFEAAWTQRLLGNPQLLSERLELDRLALEDIQRVESGDAELTEAETNARDFLAEVAGVSRSSTGRSDPFLHSIPFAPLLAPFLQVAESALQERLPDDGRLLAITAWSDLRRALVERLSEIAAKTLFQEFKQHRDTAGTLPGVFGRFVREQLADGLHSVFVDYPVLARLIAVVCEQWVVFILELIERLNADQCEIARVAGSEPPKILPLKSVAVSGDTHRGRAVAVLGLNNGGRIVYKPRRLAIERLYNELLEFLNSQAALGAGGLPQDLRSEGVFRTTRVVERDEYGWHEFVPHKACSGRSGLKSYFVRTGALLAVLHTLRATDLNYENWVACGEFPICIDAETLLHPDLPRLCLDSASASATTRNASDEQWLRSVARVRLLPNPEANADGSAVHDFSALGCIRPQRLGASLEFASINMDEMDLVRTEAAVTPSHNVVTLGGKTVEPAAYVEEISDGFRSGCRLLIDCRDHLLSGGGGLQRMRQVHSRVLFRNTGIYAQAICNSTNPDSFRDGLSFSLCHEPLSLPFLLGGGLASRWAVFQSEQRQLETLDVPYFVRRADRCELLADDGTVLCDDFFPRSGFGDAVQTLLNLGSEDIAYQERVIRGLLAAGRGSRASKKTAVGAPDTNADHANVINTALCLGERLADCATRTAGGSVNWLAIQSMPGGRGELFGPLPDRMYDGRLGVALFFGALRQATGTDRFTDIVEGCVQETCAVLAGRWSRDVFALSCGPGGMTGLGGVIYALTRLGIVERREAWIEAALMATAAVRPDFVGLDRDFDVYAGSAGLILALLSLYRHTQQRSVLRAAAGCANHLLNHRQSAERGVFWHSPGRQRKGTPRVGFAHGACGVALALARLFSVTGDARHLSVARQALAFEDDLSAAGTRVRRRRGQPFDGSLCRGTAGMLLSRLGCRSVHESLCSAFPVGLFDSLLNADETATDSLCCGSAGILEVRNTVRSHRSLWGAAQIEDAESSALPPVAPLDEPHGDPSLFRGAAGIGYALLRSALCDRIPNLLLFD